MKAKTLITGAVGIAVGAIVGREFGRIQFAKQLLDKLENEKDALEKLKEQESIEKESEDEGNSSKEDENDELESDDEETDDDEDVPYIFVIRAHSSNEGESL